MLAAIGIEEDAVRRRLWGGSTGLRTAARSGNSLATVCAGASVAARARQAKTPRRVIKAIPEPFPLNDTSPPGPHAETSRPTALGQQPPANLQWGGRFAAGPAAIMEDINASIDFDRKLWRQDIRGSLAHAAMLGKIGVISGADVVAIPTD